MIVKKGRGNNGERERPIETQRQISLTQITKIHSGVRVNKWVREWRPLTGVKNEDPRVLSVIIKRLVKEEVEKEPLRRRRRSRVPKERTDLNDDSVPKGRGMISDKVRGLFLVGVGENGVFWLWVQSGPLDKTPKISVQTPRYSRKRRRLMEQPYLPR